MRSVQEEIKFQVQHVGVFMINGRVDELLGVSYAFYLDAEEIRDLYDIVDDRLRNMVEQMPSIFLT